MFAKHTRSIFPGEDRNFRTKAGKRKEGGWCGAREITSRPSDRRLGIRNGNLRVQPGLDIVHDEGGIDGNSRLVDAYPTRDRAEIVFSLFGT